MLKKIFRQNFQEGHFKGVLSKDSLSSSGQDSETVSATDTHNHETRHFFRNPLDVTNDEEQNFEDTWDPFEHQEMRKSKSFSFKPPPAKAGLPKSRSVHFAEDLASYQAEMKRLHEQEIQSRSQEGAIEDSSENSGATLGDAGQSEESASESVVESSEGNSESVSESSESVSEESANYKSEDSRREIKSQGSEVLERHQFPHRTPDGFATGRWESASKPSSRGSDQSMHRRSKAGQALQSFFPDGSGERMARETREEREGKKYRSTVNFSDSTDVELTETQEEPQALLYPIYKQVYRMILLNTKEESACSLDQLQRDISEGFMDLEQVLKDSKSQVIELRKLKKVMEFKEERKDEEIELKRELEKRRSESRGLERRVSELEEVKQKQNDENQLLKSQILALESSIAQQESVKESAAQAYHKSIQSLTAKMAQCEQHLAQQKEKYTKNTENWTKRVNGLTQENLELSRQMNVLRQKTIEVDRFQAEENKVLIEANARLEAAAKASDSDMLDLRAASEGLGAQVSELERRVLVSEAAAIQSKNELQQVELHLQKSKEQLKMSQTRNQELEKALRESEEAVKKSEDLLQKTEELLRVAEELHLELQSQRAREKSEQQAFNLELKKEFKEMKEAKLALSAQHNELQHVCHEKILRFEEIVKQFETKTGILEEKNKLLEETCARLEERSKRLALEVHTAQSMGENFQREVEALSAEARERKMDLAAVRTSNQIAVRGLQQIIQQSYQILAPRFQPESTRHFLQIYLELAKIKFIDERNKGVVAILLAFLQTGLADIVRQYEHNEEALCAEVENRRRFQEDVLGTFRTIVKQITSQRPQRLRSPKKKPRKET